MDYHIFKSWLNRFFSKYVGGEQRPVFFDVEQTYPALHQLTSNVSRIQREFLQVYKNNPTLPLYHEIDPGEREISDSSVQAWKVYMLYLLGYKPEANCQACPETCQLLESIPNLLQAFFSILAPGKSIPLHKGPYLGYLRYHLALHVPLGDPPRLYVNHQEYIWETGKAVLFDDTWPHCVVNNSEDYRAVLIVDVLRPMPFLPNLINKIITFTIARYTYGRQVINKIKGFKQELKPLID